MSAASSTARRSSAEALSRLPAWAPAALASVGLAAATWALFSHAFLNYDTLYALIWGRDLAEGRLPDYEVPLAPTPHPLATAVAALLAPLGTDGAYTAMLALALLSFGALAWAVLRLGWVTFGSAVGVLAALVVVTRVPFLSQAVRAYVDIPFLTLTVLAAVLVAQRPRRGTAVLVLLGLAGLLRPEAWLLAAAYWMYLAPQLSTSRRIGLATLAAAAPLAWALSDLAVTGDLFHSLTGTRETAETLGRPRGLDSVPETMARRLGEILRLPVLIGGAAGFVLALLRAPDAARIPAATAILGGLAFVAFGIAGLPLIGRYLLLPAAMLAIFFAFAALGWLRQPPGRDRRRWALGGAALLALLAAFTPANVSGLEAMRDGVQLRGRIADDLRELALAPRARTLLARCPRIYVPNHRAVPILAYYLERAPEEIASAQLERPDRGAFFAPATALVEEKFVLDPRDPGRLDAAVPAGFEVAAANRSWKLHARGCG